MEKKGEWWKGVKGGKKKGKESRRHIFDYATVFGCTRFLNFCFYYLNLFRFLVATTGRIARTFFSSYELTTCKGVSQTSLLTKLTYLLLAPERRDAAIELDNGVYKILRHVEKVTDNFSFDSLTKKLVVKR